MLQLPVVAEGYTLVAAVVVTSVCPGMGLGGRATMDACVAPLRCVGEEAVGEYVFVQTRIARGNG